MSRALLLGPQYLELEFLIGGVVLTVLFRQRRRQTTLTFSCLPSAFYASTTRRALYAYEGYNQVALNLPIARCTGTSSTVSLSPPALAPGFYALPRTVNLSISRTLSYTR